MQYVRCEKCGAKALFAASRCPKCTHPFYLRDHRGALIALSHCRTCDTWFPRDVGHCKWCGEEKVVGGQKSRGVGLALIGLAIVVGGYAYWRTRAAAPIATPEPVVTAPATVPVTSLPISDSALPDSGGSSDALSGAPDTVSPVVPAPALVASVPAPTPPVVSGEQAWTTAVATTYINVRSAADRKAPVVGVLQPNTRVDVGAIARGWRQVRAPGISGWVDPRNLR